MSIHEPYAEPQRFFNKGNEHTALDGTKVSRRGTVVTTQPLDKIFPNAFQNLGPVSAEEKGDVVLSDASDKSTPEDDEDVVENDDEDVVEDEDEDEEEESGEITGVDVTDKFKNTEGIVVYKDGRAYAIYDVEETDDGDELTLVSSNETLTSIKAAQAFIDAL